MYYYNCASTILFVLLYFLFIFYAKIFTEEVGEVKTFSRLTVFEHIQDCAPALAIPYLVNIYMYVYFIHVHVLDVLENV